MFLVGQVSGLVKNFNIGIFSDIINVINVKLCMMVLTLSLILFQGHSSAKVVTKDLCSYPVKLKLCGIVKYIKQVMNTSQFLTFAHI